MLWILLFSKSASTPQSDMFPPRCGVRVSDLGTDIFDRSLLYGHPHQDTMLAKVDSIYIGPSFHFFGRRRKLLDKDFDGRPNDMVQSEPARIRIRIILWIVPVPNLGLT